jgi:hypothetical protein
LNRPNPLVVAALLFVLAVHCWSIPRTIWEYDECLYAAAIEKFEPLLHHPPPPGSPVYIAFAKIIALFTPDTLTAMIATSVLALGAGFLGFVLAFGALTDRRTGLLAALLLYTSSAVLVSGVLPQADSGALALLGFAIWACARNRAVLCGVLCALCIGWRLQLSIAVVPMLLATVVMMRTWRERFVAVAAFGVTCLLWFVPLVIATGGPMSFWRWMSRQAAYFAAHDADLSRSGQSAVQIGLRFIAHPWGPKWLSLPLLAFALLGIRLDPRLLPLACGSLAYLAFALATMDPADAVRYAIPSLPLVALLAVYGVRWLQPPLSYATEPRSNIQKRWLRPPHSILIFLYAIGSIYYTFPVLRARATSPSPPAAAARWIAANVPRDAIVLYDLPLGPHAEYLLRGWKSMRLAHYAGDAPAVIFADGERDDARGVTFRWPDTDAYRKLTRQHYGAVSVIPLLASERFRVVEGVFPPERTRDGRSWRWIGARGVIELPRAGRARLTFRTPPEYPFDENRIRVNDQVIAIKRNQTVQVTLANAKTITIKPERTFVPANIHGANNRDRRTLSVMLTRVEQLDSQPAAAQSPPVR